MNKFNYIKTTLTRFDSRNEGLMRSQLFTQLLLR